MSALEKRLGSVRPTQLIHSFGVGSLIDLPHFSVMPLGLEDWPEAYCVQIAEERLLREVQRRLGSQVEKLAGPPIDRDAGAFASTATNHVGIPTVTFPRYFRCPFCSLLAPIERFSLRTRPGRPDKAVYLHKNCNKANEPGAVPARFLVACEAGHIDDFPWHAYVHDGPSACPSDLRMHELGGTEATDVIVKCLTCGSKEKSMAEAFSFKANLPPCRGRRVHLRDFQSSPCTERSQALLLGASSAWFADSIPVLHVPQAQTDKLAQLVEEHWSTLQKAKSVDVVQFLRDEGKLPAFAAYTSTAIFAAIEARRAGAVEAEATDLKVPEWLAFTELDPTRSTPDFEVVAAPPPRGFEGLFERVGLAKRIREVTALLGFTRLVSSREMSREASGTRRMGLTRKPPRFVPASEVRGEGIFLQLDERLVSDWCDAHARRESLFFEAHKAWRKRRRIEPPEADFPRLRFVLLHSLSHALMRQLSLECGYSAASLRERIYANCDEAVGPRMAGVLIYTSAPDSEGTLGGLVRMGHPDELGRHLKRALDEMKLCSSDPLCADLEPGGDSASLHAAACHACLFAPETSCERGNKYLDRGALVRTVRGNQRGFFDAEGARG